MNCQLPPQSTETEESILSACLLDPTGLAIALDSLSPDDFYHPRHVEIFRAFISLDKAGSPVDLVTAYNELVRTGKADRVGAAELSRLTDCVPMAVNMSAYCKIVREKATLRKVIEAARKVLQICYQQGRREAVDILDDAQQAILSIQAEKSVDAVRISDLVEPQLDRYAEAIETKGEITGMRTGFADIDRMTCGLQATDLIIIAGRPSMGKSAFMANLAQNLGGQSIPGAIFSLEMSSGQLMDRFFSDNTKINLMSFRNGGFGEREMLRLPDAAGDLSEMPIWIDDTAEAHYKQIRRKARRLKREAGIRWVAIDYLQLMHGDGNGNREREISEITRNMKLMAKELEIPVLLLSQLNRALENRDNKRPKLSDLRESGAIEQDSDIVCFLYREEVYSPKPENEGKGEIVIAKQRNGPTGIIPVLWDKRTASYRNIKTI